MGRTEAKQEDAGAQKGVALCAEAQEKERATEESLARLARVLQTMRQIDHLIIHASDRRRLIEECCQSLTKTEVYFGASIYSLDESGQLDTVAQSGYQSPCQKRETQLPACANLALETRSLVAVRERQLACRDCAFSKDFPQHCSYCVPIGHGEAIYGILMILAPQDFLMESEERELIHDVASDIALGIRRITLEEGRRKANLKLRSNEARMRTMLDAISNIIVCLSIEGSVTEFNPEAERFFGQNRTDLIGHDFFALIHPAKAQDALRQLCEESYHSGQARSCFEVLLHDEQRRARKMLWTISPITMRDSKATGLILSGQDITARDQAELSLRKQEATLASLFLAAPIGIGRIEQGAFKLVNEQFARMTGYSRNELAGKPLSTLIAAQEEAKEIEANLAADIREQGMGAQEIQLRRKSGLPLDILVTVSALDPCHVDHGLIFTAMDLSERKEAEATARQVQEQLMQAEKMVSLGILVSGIAHEINNPNHIILSHASLLHNIVKDLLPILNQYYKTEGEFDIGGLEYSLLKDRLQGMVESISNASMRIKRIVEELRDYAHERPKADIEAVHINRVVESALILLSNFLKKKSNHFEVSYGEKIPIFPGNYQRLEQVVINLVQNACEALDNASEKIAVATYYEQEEKIIVLEVRDEGHGIPEEHLPYLTAPFFSTRREEGKAGLGLASCAETVKEHHGQLFFHSELEKGSLVRVVIPLSPQQRAD